MKYYGIVLIALLFVNSINAQINTCKCCTESHSEFDFWIGTWEVTNKDGSIAGQNVIKKK